MQELATLDTEFNRNLHHLCTKHALSNKGPLLKHFRGNAQEFIDKGLAHITDGKESRIYPTERAKEQVKALGLPLYYKRTQPSPDISWQSLLLEAQVKKRLEEAMPDARILHAPNIDWKDDTSNFTTHYYNLVITKDDSNHIVMLDVHHRPAGTTLWAPSQETGALWYERKRCELPLLDYNHHQKHVIDACAEASLPKLNFHFKRKFTARPTVSQLVYWYGDVKIGDDRTLDPITVKNRITIVPGVSQSDNSILGADIHRLVSLVNASFQAAQN